MYLEVEVGGAGVVVPLARVLDLVSPQLTIVTRGGGGTGVNTGSVEATRKQLATKFREIFLSVQKKPSSQILSGLNVEMPVNMCLNPCLDSLV